MSATIDGQEQCFAYECMHCLRRFCLRCQTTMPDAQAGKTAVAWCDNCVKQEAEMNGLSLERMREIRSRRQRAH